MHELQAPCSCTMNPLGTMPSEFTFLKGRFASSSLSPTISIRLKSSLLSSRYRFK